MEGEQLQHRAIGERGDWGLRCCLCRRANGDFREEQTVTGKQSLWREEVDPRSRPPPNQRPLRGFACKFRGPPSPSLRMLDALDNFCPGPGQPCLRRLLPEASAAVPLLSAARPPAALRPDPTSSAEAMRWRSSGTTTE